MDWEGTVSEDTGSPSLGDRKFVKRPIAAFTIRDRTNYDNDLKIHKDIIDKFYDQRVNWKTSNLGTILFKNADPKLFQHGSRSHKRYLVLVWRYLEELKETQIFNYRQLSYHKEPDLLEGCSVKNCKFTGDDENLAHADAVILDMKKNSFPIVQKKSPKQRWIFYSDVTPVKLLGLHKISDVENMFNWTMTYRSDSDIPIPYGRTVPFALPAEIYLGIAEVALANLVPDWDEKQFIILASIYLPNCMMRGAMKIVKDLRKYISVDIQGCISEAEKNSFTCTEPVTDDCKIMSNYLFYLVIEDSSCRQYITEKCFHFGYAKGAIPVIMGPPVKDCEKLLPPNSFLHVDNYKSLRELTDHMKQITETFESILVYHAWRKHFAVINEHGKFGRSSPLFCRVCEALNYNDGETNVYETEDLELFFDKKLTCKAEYNVS
ncbi:alpha-(1,3)-fucosyltransferase 7-like [Pectinophora gossypiella]|uniref:alpha-(1,3)-fucosyltransferase 7-like n=1 Tax=Pectinophora gossypiella TaxID=13191 RepID=UPI00214EF747|nr:alpha-(1,3)-fucosyltransferase 7-like [Pectinophora gossypiella]